jgi:hypothetical protein
MGFTYMGLELIVVITGEWSENKSKLGSIALYVEEIPFVTKKSKKSGCVLGSVGQYFGVPVVRMSFFL